MLPLTQVLVGGAIAVGLTADSNADPAAVLAVAVLVALAIFYEVLRVLATRQPAPADETRDTGIPRERPLGPWNGS